MSVIRVIKDNNYVTMGKYHLKERKMSLKAKGLLSQMLSLPDNWDYSIAGLTKINKEGADCIRNILKELETFGYLKRTQIKDETGKFVDIEYLIYEKPKTETPITENPLTEKPMQLNNKELNNNKLNNKYNIYGTFKRIKLTQEEYDRLVKEFGESFIKKQIDELDKYVESNNNKNKYTNFNLVLRKAIRENWFNKKQEQKPTWFNQEIPQTNINDEEWQGMLDSFN